MRAAARHARAVLASPACSLESRYRASLALASLHDDARDYEEAVRLYRTTQDVVKALGDDLAMASWMGRTAASQAAQGLSFWSLLIFPLLFTAGMSLVDTTDSVLMVRAYGWAFVKPIRKLYYNLTITSVSVVVAILIGGVQALGLIAEKLALSGGLWDWIAMLNEEFGALGYLIIALFIVSWIASVAIYRLKGYDQLEIAAETIPAE